MARDNKSFGFFKPEPPTPNKSPADELPTTELPVAQHFIDMENNINDLKTSLEKAKDLLRTRRLFKPDSKEALETEIALSSESLMRQKDHYETEKAAALENGTYYRSAP